MGPGGVETSAIPVGPDDSTAFHALQGVAEDDLATGTSSATGDLLVSSEGLNWLRIIENQ